MRDSQKSVHDLAVSVNILMGRAGPYVCSDMEDLLARIRAANVRTLIMAMKYRDGLVQMTRYLAVTTCNAQMWERYGGKMAETFLAALA